MRWLWVVAVSMALAIPAAAQDPSSNPEELNRKYQDALAQLKAAQDRKNELATENERLTARVAELEKLLEDARRELATTAQQSFMLRSHYAAWQAFLKRYPVWLERWNIFLESNPLAEPAELPEMFDPKATLPAK